MRIRVFSILFLGLLAFSTLGTATNLQTYYVYTYPKSDLGCEGEAAALAERFTAATKLPVVEHGCYKDNGRDYDLFVSYAASVPLPVVSSVFSELVPSTYGSFSECNQALATETEHFESETRVKAVVSYCSKDGQASGSKPVQINIEGFGTAVNPPREDENMLTGVSPVVDVDSLAALIKERINQMGVDAVQVVIRREDDFFSGLVTRYYGKKRAPFSFQRLGKFNSVEKCQSVLEELAPAFDRSAPGSLGIFCASSVLTENESELYLYRLELGYTMTASNYSRTYSSSAQCESDRTRVLDMYVQELKRPAMATLCEDGPDGYIIRVFEVYQQ